MLFLAEFSFRLSGVLLDKAFLYNHSFCFQIHKKFTKLREFKGKSVKKSKKEFKKFTEILKKFTLFKINSLKKAKFAKKIQVFY